MAKLHVDHQENACWQELFCLPSVICHSKICHRFCKKLFHDTAMEMICSIRSNSS